jgi:catechol 2,3-dioxygenase-like lactoylglutathione lyase family enzyme
MPAKKKAVPRKKAVVRKQAAPRKKAVARPDVPQFFRMNVEVGDLPAAAAFYAQLLGLPARVQAGSRAFFTCGAVTLVVLDVTAAAPPHPAAKCLYFTVRDLEAVFTRAHALAALSRAAVHGTPGGAIAVRPWGERSFYAEDPWGNPLCFVEAGTVYPG